MIIGVTGKIASGKSEVMKVLAKNGFYCIDADKITHELYLSGHDGAKKIQKIFGEEYLKKNGSVDRIKLRNLVFNDPRALQLLNKTIHPLVFNEIKNRVHGHENVAIESVYFDSKYLGKIVSKIILVKRPRLEIENVLKKKRRFSDAMISKSIDLIKNFPKKSILLKNDQTLGDLKKSVSKILKNL